MGSQQPLPHHIQGGAAAAPGQGQSWPLCVTPVLCHLRADSPFSDKLAGVPTKPGAVKELEPDTAPREAMRRPTKKEEVI